MYVFPPFASLTVEEFLTHYFTSSDYKEDGNGMRVQVLSSRFGGVRMIWPRRSVPRPCRQQRISRPSTRGTRSRVTSQKYWNNIKVVS
ncbi:putative magnesium transporter NIPA8 [Fusarium oxysporum f. sp. albedinis]|nr:putative magnesium transporter NIPA8 [Fusarium oxysporum f. sp. albedinis]